MTHKTATMRSSPEGRTRLLIGGLSAVGVLLAAALVGVACEQDLELPSHGQTKGGEVVSPPAQQAEPVAVRSPGADPASANAATNVAAARLQPAPLAEQPFTQETPDLTLYRQVDQRNAEGEIQKVYVPIAPPVVEVPLGAECGFEAADGTNISCEPGLFCMRASETETALCVAGPLPPRVDG